MKMANRELTIFFSPISELGHISASIGIACALKQRGHRIVFATEKSWSGKFAEYGFNEEIYTERDGTNESLGKYWAEFLARTSHYFIKPAIEQADWCAILFEEIFQALKYSHKQMEKIVEKVKPDIIIIDHVMTNPALVNTGIPIVYSLSANPLMAFTDERLPPQCLGLPIDDRSQWENQRKMTIKAYRNLWLQYSEWMKSLGAPKLDENKFIHRSSNLNIYMYPDALVNDYLKLCPLDKTWLGLSHAIRESKNLNFRIPEKLRELSGKLIYFSLGFTGSSIVELLKRLIAIFSRSKHRFIIAKGHFLNDFELPSNIWGETFVPQIEILPLVDLVITHGGNNSLLETLYFAKPLIVLPLLGDQHDNAQRVVEKRVGIKFNPFIVTDDQLLTAIDSLLLNEEIHKKIAVISQQMRESKSMDRVVQRIESIADNPMFPTVL